MRMFMLSVSLLLVAVSGCSSNNKGKIEGTKWTSIQATVDGNILPAGALGLEFGSDGSLSYRTPIGTYNGTYSLGAANSVTLRFDRELAGLKRHRESVEINGDNLKMTDPDGTSLSFQRVKP